MKKKILYLWSKLHNKRRAQLLWLLLLTVVTSIIEAISIGAVMPFLGALTSPEFLYENKYISPVLTWLSIEDDQHLLPLFSLFFATLILISGALKIALLWIQTRIGFAIGVDFDKEIFNNILHKPYSEHLTCNSSELISGLTTKTSQVVMNLIIPSLSILSSILILVAVFSLLVLVNPMLAIISLLGFGLIYIAIYLAVRKTLKNASNRISAYQNAVIKIIQESLGSIRDIIIDGLQSVFHLEHFHANLTLKRAMGNNLIIANTPKFGIEAIALATIVVVASVFIDSSNGIVEVLPILGLIILAAQRMLPLLQQIFSSISLIKGVDNTAEDVINLLREDSCIQYHEQAFQSSVLSFKYNIKLNNISYRYSSNEPWIFQNMNFKFTKGEVIGIVGKTGSGKSTLVDLLLGLLAPTKGELMVDNEIIDIENNLAWQKQIAHVPQTIFLSDSTIAENIAFGTPLNKINYDLVQQAAKGAHISDTIDSWKNKYDTIVGENGIRLSGGQRQRIGIARALYKKTNVIIFDEATSALDVKTEARVMKVINEISNNITIFIIAHRLSTLEGCDRIVDLDK